MDISHLRLQELLVITPPYISDDYGSFRQTYNTEIARVAGIELSFVQDNEMRSLKKYTLRGLYCQTPPFAQAKLIRVSQGRSWHVAVDARHDSPTFGKWDNIELSDKNGHQLWVPAGFLHGFITLEDKTIVNCKGTSLDHESAQKIINLESAQLGIKLPVEKEKLIIPDNEAKKLIDFGEIGDWFLFKD